VHGRVSALMKETHKFIQGFRGEADNFYCFADVGDVTVLVSDIDVERQKVVVTLNPNTTHYQQTKPRPFMGGTLSTQSIGGELKFRPTTLSPDNHDPVTIDGKQFIIRPVSFGHVNERGDKRAYCDIEVEAVVDIPA